MGKVLYLGLEVSKKWLHFNPEAKVLHAPIIKIEEFSLDHVNLISAFKQFEKMTHLLLTSKVSVRLFFQALTHFQLSRNELSHKIIMTVGAATAEIVKKFGGKVSYCASEESSEGIVELLREVDLTNAYFFWPCSALSRQIIPAFFKEKNIPFCAVALYTTVSRNPDELSFKELSDVDELVFTSPSTVDAFLDTFKTIPWNKKITAIGPITEARLKEEKLSCQSQIP